MEQSPEHNYSIGNTTAELEKLRGSIELEKPTFAAEAEYIETVVEEWGDGYATAEETCRKLHSRYLQDESYLPQAAIQILIKAADVWFPYEADMDLQTVASIKSEEQFRVLWDESRSN